jgi:hypothetical protein
MSDPWRQRLDFRLARFADDAREAWLLSAVSRRSGLPGRIRHLLEGPGSSPISGRGWSLGAMLLTALLAGCLALAQARPTPPPRPTEAAPWEADDVPTKLSGSVSNADGNPAAGAAVLWIGYRKPRVSYAVEPPIMPRGRVERPTDREEVVGESTTGADGRFRFAIKLDPGRFYPHTRIVVLARGSGLCTRSIRPDEHEITLKLVREAPVSGRLLTPVGAPAAGARVSLVSLHGESPAEAEFMPPADSDEDLPSYWPRSQQTDAKGRFTLHGIPVNSVARLRITHPDHAVDDLFVNTRGDAAVPDHLSSFVVQPVPPDFTHTLEPARPVQGRVIDAVTGKPMADVLIEMSAMRSSHGQTFRTRTDAEGRYRVSGQQGDRYVISAYPPPDSGYVSLQDRRSWPAGEKVLNVDLALPKGRLLRGRVVHAETGEPIADAVVAYEPARGNPNDLAGYELNNPTLTDANGQFAITGIAGPGFVLVEAPMIDAIRVRLVPGRFTKYAMHPHGFARLDVPASGDQAPVEIAVRRGVKLEARILTPDGRPVSGFAAYCPDLSGQLNRAQHMGVDYPGDRFIVHGADPDHTYRIMFTEGEHGYGAFALLRPEPGRPEPVPIRLKPLARVHGKVVTAAGTPVTTGHIYARMIVTDASGPFTDDELFTHGEFYTNLLPGQTRGALFDRGAPDARGEFVLDQLMPGARLYLTASSSGRGVNVPIPELKPGDDIDLGTITLHEQHN